MEFEFTVYPQFNFVTSFAEKFNIPVFNNKLTIPASMGRGYIKVMDIAPGIKFVLHHYTLNEVFHLKRLAPKEDGGLVSIIFNSNEIPTGHAVDRQTVINSLKTNGSAMQVGSSSLGTETIFPADMEVHFAVIGITPAVLSSLLRIEEPNNIVKTILSGEQGFFYHENMFPAVQRILHQLSEIDDQNKLSRLYYKIKIEELLYLLFSKLLERESESHNHINKTDMDSMYAIRTTIIADLSVPPRLAELSRMAGMSQTKMKQLFRQIFGDSIYNYYQKARMDEAAFLLRQAGYSVTEAGYQLGFSNLSHFSRLFLKHNGLTPKKYALAG